MVNRTADGIHRTDPTFTPTDNVVPLKSTAPATMSDADSKPWNDWFDIRMAQEKDVLADAVGHAMSDLRHELRQEAKQAHATLEADIAKKHADLLERIIAVREEVSKMFAAITKRQAENESRAIDGMQMRLRQAEEMRERLAVIEKGAKRWMEEVEARDGHTGGLLFRS